MRQRWVVDASVAVKWLVPTLPEEGDIDQALTIMAKAAEGEIVLHQPPHFIAETMGVIARLKPAEAPDILRDLLNTEFHQDGTSAIYATATELSVRLSHHLFDTLYHAVAFHIPEAVLVTADERYYNKAKNEGRIVLLKDFSA